MGEVITLTTEDGHELDAYRAEPSGAARAGLVVIQEIFGVNSHMRNVCDRFAADGYMCLSPALFDRTQRNVELGYTTDAIAEGRELRAQVGWDGPVLDVKACIGALREAGCGKVGAVGYCWGGSLSWLASTRLGVDCAVGYYGGQIIQFVEEQPNAPTMLHFGSEDGSIPLSDVEAIRSKHPEVMVHVYEGAGHGFSCDQRADFNAAASKIARQRTLDHFTAHLG